MVKIIRMGFAPKDHPVFSGGPLISSVPKPTPDSGTEETEDPPEQEES